MKKNEEAMMKDFHIVHDLFRIYVDRQIDNDIFGGTLDPHGIKTFEDMLKSHQWQIAKVKVGNSTKLIIDIDLLLYSYCSMTGLEKTVLEENITGANIIKRLKKWGDKTRLARLDQGAYYLKRVTKDEGITIQLNCESDDSREDIPGEKIVIQTVVGAIVCEQLIAGEWHVVEDINAARQYFGKSFKDCIEGIRKYYSGELGNEPGNAKLVIFTKAGFVEYSDTPIYMIVKHRDRTTGRICLTQSRDFHLSFKSVDDNDLEIIERVHYSDNTLDKALEFWSEKLGIPIMGNTIDVLPQNFLM